MQSFKRGGDGTGTGRVPQPGLRGSSSGTCPGSATILYGNPRVCRDRATVPDRGNHVGSEQFSVVASRQLAVQRVPEREQLGNVQLLEDKLRNPPEWTNEHPDTSPQDVQLNCAPMEALAKAKQVMEASPLCSRFTIRTTSGQTRTLDDLAHVEWMKPEDMSEPVQPVQSIAEETLAYDEDQQYLQDVQMTEMLATKVARVATPGAVSTLNTFRICAG